MHPAALPAADCDRVTRMCARNSQFSTGSGLCAPFSNDSIFRSHGFPNRRKLLSDGSPSLPGSHELAKVSFHVCLIALWAGLSWPPVDSRVRVWVPVDEIHAGITNHNWNCSLLSYVFRPLDSDFLSSATAHVSYNTIIFDIVVHTVLSKAYSIKINTDFISVQIDEIWVSNFYFKLYILYVNSRVSNIRETDWSYNTRICIKLDERQKWRWMYNLEFNFGTGHSTGPANFSVN